MWKRSSATIARHYLIIHADVYDDPYLPVGVSLVPRPHPRELGLVRKMKSAIKCA